MLNLVHGDGSDPYEEPDSSAPDEDGFWDDGEPEPYTEGWEDPSL